MSTTVQQVIDRAVDRSGLNSAVLVSTPAVIAKMSAEQRRLFIDAALVDPEYFGKDALTGTRAAYTDSWDLDAAPGDVGVVTKVTVATLVGTVTGVPVGTKVNLVNSRWPDLDVSPRAYIRGRKIVPHSTELGAASNAMASVLRIYYSELPPNVSAVGTSLRLPDEWTQLLVLPIARYLAIRDKREEEVPLLDQEYALTYQTFRDSILAYSHGSRRPLPSVAPVPPAPPRSA